MSPEEKAKELGVPVIPKLPEHVKKQPFDENPIVGVCGECGIELRRMMCYSCNNPNFPVFRKTTC